MNDGGGGAPSPFWFFTEGGIKQKLNFISEITNIYSIHSNV
jgi:hypothetical protein